ncbi:MAG: YitT family protein [Oscillospiraceae bacterium]|nr:YitT family protein [Oscillospiraceae bacterium]MCL2278613.1 YitT family protein [Oscillospiraceae bacterium]
MKKLLNGTVTSYAGSLFGAFLFVLGINVIIVPHELYSGTMTGVAQMIESLLMRLTNIRAPEGSNLTGAVLLLLNIPLMIMVLRVTNKSFPVKSIINIIFMNTVLSLVPIPESPLIGDTLTSCIVGGALAGFGAGFTLRNGGSGGGSDLIGVYCSAKYPNFTVGKASLMISVVVYTYCIIVYDFNTVIYSAIFTLIYATVLDFTHHQNIKTSALIFTTNPDAMQSVMNRLNRSATHWEGKGGYSGQHTNIFITVVSKYEISELKRVVAAADPRAFIVMTSNVSIFGTFEKRL